MEGNGKVLAYGGRRLIRVLPLTTGILQFMICISLYQLHSIAWEGNGKIIIHSAYLLGCLKGQGDRLIQKQMIIFQNIIGVRCTFDL